MSDGASHLTRWARWGLLVYLLVPVVLTLSGRAPDEVLEDAYGTLRQFADMLTQGQVVVSRRQTESLLNVLMYLPLGLMLRLSFPQRAFAVLLLAMAASSVAIEVAQQMLLPDRNPSLTDVLNNTAGAAIGLGLGGDVQSVARRRAAR